MRSGEDWSRGWLDGFGWENPVRGGKRHSNAREDDAAAGRIPSKFIASRHFSFNTSVNRHTRKSEKTTKPPDLLRLRD